VASSWILFFSYQDDARPNTHQILPRTSEHEGTTDSSDSDLARPL